MQTLLTSTTLPERLFTAQDRPEGLHLSQVITYLMQTLYPDRYGGELNYPKIAAGLAYEQALEAAIRTLLVGHFRPPPLQMDGIWCSPDGLDPVTWRLDEFKCTWYSAKKDCPLDPVFWPWLVQIKGYCHALGTTKARLCVFFVNGTYQPPSPLYREWQLDFTPEEIADNWQMIRTAAKEVPCLPQTETA